MRKKEEPPGAPFDGKGLSSFMSGAASNGMLLRILEEEQKQTALLAEIRDALASAGQRTPGLG